MDFEKTIVLSITIYSMNGCMKYKMQCLNDPLKTVHRSTSVSANVLKDTSGQTCVVTKNSDKKACNKYAYVIAGDNDKIVFDKKSKLDISKAFAIKMSGLNLNEKYHDVTITTKVSTDKKITVGKIALKSKKVKNEYGETVSPYKGSREIKFTKQIFLLQLVLLENVNGFIL